LNCLDLWTKIVLFCLQVMEQRQKISPPTIRRSDRDSSSPHRYHSRNRMKTYNIERMYHLPSPPRERRMYVSHNERAVEKTQRERTHSADTKNYYRSAWLEQRVENLRQKSSRWSQRGGHYWNSAMEARDKYRWRKEERPPESRYEYKSPLSDCHREPSSDKRIGRPKFYYGNHYGQKAHTQRYEGDRR
jgi:hypothetical protein